MKIVKITKRDLKKTPEELLMKVGAVVGVQAFPSEVYMSSKDYSLLKKNLKAMYKKDFPFISKKQLDLSVGMHLLNYGPNESMGDAIKTGFVLVDFDKINELSTNVEAR